MFYFSENTHSFIVRIWLEPREIKGARAKLKGMIEHVGSEETESFCDLNTIMDFIKKYIQQCMEDA